MEVSINNFKLKYGSYSKKYNKLNELGNYNEVPFVAFIAVFCLFIFLSLLSLLFGSDSFLETILKTIFLDNLSDEFKRFLLYMLIGSIVGLILSGLVLNYKYKTYKKQYNSWYNELPEEGKILLEKINGSKKKEYNNK